MGQCDAHFNEAWQHTEMSGRIHSNRRAVTVRLDLGAEQNEHPRPCYASSCLVKYERQQYRHYIPGAASSTGSSCRPLPSPGMHSSPWLACSCTVLCWLSSFQPSRLHYSGYIYIYLWGNRYLRRPVPSMESKAALRHHACTGEGRGAADKLFSRHGWVLQWLHEMVRGAEADSMHSRG